jgi:hypothetical protein
LGAATDCRHRGVDVLGQLLRAARLRLPTRALRSQRERQCCAALHLLRETGAFHFIFVDQGKAVAVPLDGTGPTYTAKFSDKDLENIRAVRHGDVLVETDTDLIRTVAHGSDGSTAFVTLHAHFTVNANGEMTVQFETDKLVCA